MNPDDLTHAMRGLADDGRDRPHPLTAEEQVEQFRSARRRRRAAQLGAAGGIALLVVAIPVLAGSLVGGRTGPLGDGGASASCAERHDPQTLARRTFAFDGTVTAVGTEPAYTPAGAEPSVADPVPVTFRVNEWFRGGTGDQVTVALPPPDSITSAGNSRYRVGTRLLVSGEPRAGTEHAKDLIAWQCGFTRYYDENSAATWRETLRERKGATPSPSRGTA